MSNAVQVRYTIAMRGLRAQYNPLVRVYPSASPRVYMLTRALWAHNPLLAIVYPIHTNTMAECRSGRKCIAVK